MSPERTLEIGPANQAYYHTMLRRTMISLAWAKVLRTEATQSAQRLQAEATVAEKNGDVKRVKVIFSGTARLAAHRIREHELVNSLQYCFEGFNCFG